MRSVRSTWAGAVLALAGLALSDAVSPAALYREDFSSTPPLTGVGLDNVGWSGAEVGDGNSAGVYDTFNWWFSNVSQASMSFRTELIYTTEFSATPISMSTGDLAISWATRMEHQFNDLYVDESGVGFGADVSPAIQVGGQWYVADAFHNTGNVISATYDPPAVFNFAGSTWSTLDGVDGAPGVSYGSSASPSGDITGVGLVATFVQRQTVNVDFVEISGVPEPTSLGLLAFGGAALAVGRARKRAR